ncbi:MAG: VOC family protein [Marinibacterium sp.]
MLQLDHMAVAGETLREATEAVEAALGVKLQAGGRHAFFATRNCLLGLADGLYLEAIAVDPGAPAPTRPRWFDLDRFAGPPRLTNWICRVPDLDAALAALPGGVGDPVDLARGKFRWRMAVPGDGRLPFDNLFPAQISWLGDAHPGDHLTASGCRLSRLVVTHPEARALSAVLAPFLRDPRVVFDPGAAGLLAELDTPHGRRLLR